MYYAKNKKAIFFAFLQGYVHFQFPYANNRYPILLPEGIYRLEMNITNKKHVSYVTLVAIADVTHKKFTTAA